MVPFSIPAAAILPYAKAMLWIEGALSLRQLFPGYRAGVATAGTLRMASQILYALFFVRSGRQLDDVKPCSVTAHGAHIMVAHQT
jgi:hypothetical protein